MFPYALKVLNSRVPNFAIWKFCFLQVLNFKIFLFHIFRGHLISRFHPKWL